MRRMTTIAAATIVGALLLSPVVLASPASAEDAVPAPTATPEPSATPAPAAAVSAPPVGSTGETGNIAGGVNLSRVTLANGHYVGTPIGTAPELQATVNTSTQNAFTVRGNTRGPAVGINATVAYQIVMLDKPSGFWAVMNVTDGGNEFARATCEVFKGDPSAGGTKAETSPFTCDIDRTQKFPNAKFTFTLALNRYVETAGVLKTTGAVSLKDGHFEAEGLPYEVPGTPTVPTNSSTRFETVVRDGDQPDDPDLARILFSYQIVDAGTDTTFWVAGWSSNYRGSRFSREGTCFVVDQNPLAANSPALDKLNRNEVTPYSCSLTGERWIGSGYGAYEATFTVAKRVMQVVEEPYRQRELVNQYCGASIENCGLGLATVTTGYGVGRRVTETVGNTGDQPLTVTRTTSSSETVSNTEGFKLTTEAEYTILGGKWKISLEVNYSHTAAVTTTTSLSVPFKIPPHSSGWLEGYPPMIHTVGTVYIRDGDRYFALPNVTADFPNADQGSTWNLVPMSEPLVSGALPPVVGETPPASVPASLTPGQSTPAQAAEATTGRQTATALASTGRQESDITGLAALSAILLATGSLIALARRRRRTRNHPSA